MKLKNSILSLFLSSSILRLSTAFLSFLFTVYVTNTFTLEIAGEILLYFATFSFLSYNFRFGFDTFLLKHLNSTSEENNEFSTFINAFLIYVIFFIIGLFSILLFSKPSLTFLIFYFSLFFNGIHFLVSIIFQARNNAFFGVVFQNFLFLLILLSISAFLSVDKENDFAYVFLSSSFITSIVSLFFFFRVFSFFKFTNKLLEFLKSSFPFFVILLCSQLSQWSSQFLLGYFKDDATVALFSSSQRIGMLISLFLVSINFIVAPRFADLYFKKQYQDLLQVFKKSALFVSLITMPLVIGVAFYAEYVLSIFGDEYVDSSFVLRVLCVGQIVNVLTGSVAILLNMTGNESLVRNVSLMGACLSLVSGFLLIPEFGLLGAAISTAFTISVVNVVNLCFVVRFFKVKLC